MVSSEVGGSRWSWAGGALHVVHLGDEFVAFHDTTASTHVFDGDTHALLVALRQVDRPVTSAILWSTVFGEAATESDCQALEEMLEKLHQSGLVTATHT